jgi:glycosyltransferase involved in cell wall biosynthesis
MHILLIHQVFATPNDGGGTRHYELCRRLVADGCQVTVITSDVRYLTGRVRREKPPIINGIEMRYAWSPRSMHKGFLGRLWAFLVYSLTSFWVAIRVRHVDLVWGTSPPLPQVATARLVAALDHTPFLFEVRDLWIDNAIELGIVHNRLVIGAAHFLESQLYRAAARVMVNSPGFVTEVGKRSSPSKVAVIPNGVECGDFLPLADPDEYRSLFDLPRDKVLVLYTGNTGMANDLDTVIAAAHLLGQRPEVDFHIYGSGMETGRLMRLAKDSHLTSVHLHEPVPKTMIPKLLCCADICLAPLRDISRFSLVFPNKVFDYMAAGRPTVYTIGGPLRDALTLAGAGEYAEPGNPTAMATAILGYAENPSLRRVVGRRAAAYAAVHFDRSIAAGQLAALLTEMVSHGK